MLNCKVGDICVQIKVDAGEPLENLGSLMEIIGIGIDFSDEGDPRYYWDARGLSSGWLLLEKCPETYVRYCPGEKFYIPDECCRPIRDTDGEDETLQWAGMPLKATEALQKQVDKLMASQQRLQELVDELARLRNEP